MYTGAKDLRELISTDAPHPQPGSPAHDGSQRHTQGTNRATRRAATALLLLCLLQAACAGRPRPRPPVTARPTAGARAATSPVEFIGVFEERAVLAMGLRKARTLTDLVEKAQESYRSGRASIRATFKVSRVLTDCARRPKRGDRVSVTFRTPADPNDPGRLPNELIGRQFRIVLYDEFSYRYRGRFSCSEWCRARTNSPAEILAIVQPR